MEHCLVDAVCDVGVDIHKAINCDHISPMLAFVGGLGLRKAESLKQSIRKRIKGPNSCGIISRNEILEKRLLGPIVYTNAASFLRILEERVVNSNLLWDPFDDTRIHPECYISNDFAYKICGDALEVEIEDNKYHDYVIKLMTQSRKTLLQKKLDKDKTGDTDWIDLWLQGNDTVVFTKCFFYFTHLTLIVVT